MFTQKELEGMTPELRQKAEALMAQSGEFTAKIIGENGSRKLRIELPIHEAVSKSGKAITFASTHGNKLSEVVYNGKKAVIGVNAYIPKE